MVMISRANPGGQAAPGNSACWSALAPASSRSWLADRPVDAYWRQV